MTYHERVGEVRKAHRELSKATKRLHDLISETWPVGTHVGIKYGNGVVRGTVVETSWERLCLKLDSTGKRFWVDAWHIYREE